MFFVNILGTIMRYCYNIFGNYGIAIIVFTLISKVILLPISIFVQKDSIKMVKMLPSINKIKIKYFGDRDKIDDEQSKIYKKEKYNPLVSIIPLVIQIVLLLGLVEVINKPLTYILEIPKGDIEHYVDVTLEKNEKMEKDDSSIEIEIVRNIKNDKYIEEYGKNKEIEKIKKFDSDFLGIDLNWIASEDKGLSLLIPFIAGFSALVLCIAQNAINVLQNEQSKFNKYGMLIFSVALSLYLGAFVAGGVALYWTASNLFAVIQQWLLNIFINPKKYVDYDELMATTEELKKLNSLNTKDNKRTKIQMKKEKEDYKRFFSTTNKHLVFYSESNGFFKYYRGIINYLLENTNIIIHYITSDYNDDIFKNENKRIKPYYIEEKKLTVLMMKMDADVVVMTMPDLQKYHIKRSYIRDDIEYIYIPHGMDSLNLTMRKGSMNHYDTVFTTGKYQRLEAEKTNELYKLENRKIVDWGYSLLDDMIDDYNKEKHKNKKKTILIAPSWQPDNIIDLCLEQILDKFKNSNYDVIVRPHPQHVRHMKEKFDNLIKEYSKYDNITIQTDFSSTSTVFNADLMITDWSGIAYEYSYTTKKPVVFIDTPMKIMNEDYLEIGVEPFNIWARDKIGQVVKLNEIDKIKKTVDVILSNSNKYKKEIENLGNDSVYNLGISGEVGANYIIDSIKEKIERRKEEK